MTDSIFISYRRRDSPGHVNHLDSVLSARFGRNAVFRDLLIGPGENFVAVLKRRLALSKVFIAVIGPRWATELDSRRAEGSAHPASGAKTDWVLTEIREALVMGIPIIPVLVDDAAMPDVSGLPNDIERFAFCNALKLRNETWDRDVEVLAKSIESFVQAPKPRLRLVTALGVLLMAVVAVGLPQRSCTKETLVDARPDKSKKAIEKRDNSGDRINSGSPGTAPRPIQELRGAKFVHPERSFELQVLDVEVVSAGAGERYLKLEFRGLNRGDGLYVLDALQTRVVIDGVPLAPIDRTYGNVYGNSARNFQVAFVVPKGVKSASLRVISTYDSTKELGTVDFPLVD
ncbi:MAG: toll/interleukin-1 receptor domain-containing protein [Bryobacterales bacterium]|nr:toll/interleukin-1 receptor domain-containing protein [Bryobacterales bacterium]